MGISVENQMCYAFGKVHIRNIFQHARMLIPAEGKGSKSFGSNPWFPVKACRRHTGLNRFKFETTDKCFGPWLPEFAHRNICILVVFKNICREDISRRRFE